MKLQFGTPAFLLSLFITFLAVIGSTAYIFFIKSDYSYFIEAACDPNTTSCYYRDCSEEDACYEYQTDIYKLYEIEATEFEKCGGLACVEQCESGVIECTEVACDPEGEECYIPVENEDNESATELEAEDQTEDPS